MPTRRAAMQQAPARRGEFRVQVLEIQRSRLLAGALAAIDELGYGHASVAHITARARISRRTFYELFANREACLAAILDDTARIVEAELAAAVPPGLAWRERVRAGLSTILAFLDREPALARVCVVQALRADQTLLGRREELLARLAAVVDEGRRETAGGATCSPLTAEGLVGAAFAIVHARLLRGGRAPLADLVGELMALIVLPYLGPAAARRERSRRAPSQRNTSPRTSHGTLRGGDDPFAGVPMRLTYRTARVLDAVAQLSGLEAEPSNRQIADHAGVHDPGQISKLLRRLERLGLLANANGSTRAKGEANAWRLTIRGERVARSVSLHPPSRLEAA